MKKINIPIIAGLILLSTIFLIGSEINRIDINQQLRIYASKAKADTARSIHFPLSSIIPLESWEKMIILRPYTTQKTLDSLSLDDIDDLGTEVQTIRWDDSKNILLFVKGSKILGYSAVARSIVDFSVTSNTDMGKPNLSFSKNECYHLSMKASDRNLVVVSRAKN